MNGNHPIKPNAPLRRTAAFVGSTPPMAGGLAVRLVQAMWRQKSPGWASVMLMLCLSAFCPGHLSAANVMSYGAGGNDYFQFTTPTVSFDRASGFTTLIAFTMHVDADGTLRKGNTVICSNGIYVGPANWNSLVTAVKTPPTTVTRYEVCIGGSADTSYDNIKSLITAQGIGASSMLNQNFKALKAAVPAIDAINDDDEQTYDLDSSTKFANMLGSLGFKFTLVPYTSQSFWVSLKNSITNCDYVYLQCYAGGAGNDPVQWNSAFGNGVVVIPGQQSGSSDPANFRNWHAQTGVQGGFYYPDTTFTTTYWSASIIEGLGNAPASPAGVVAKQGIEQANLSWSMVPGAMRYFVKRSTTSGSESQIAEVDVASYNWPYANRYSDKGLVAGTTYYYVVSAVNANGESINSSEVSVAPLPKGNYRTTIMQDSPVAYWRLDDGYSATVATNSGSLGTSVDGVYSGGFQGAQTGAIAGDPDTATYFDGASAMVQAPYNADMNPNGPFTIECWAYSGINDGNYHSPLSSRDILGAGNTAGYMFYQNTANNWTFWTGVANGSFQGINGSSVNVGQWEHLVGVYDGTRIKLYVNGVLANTAISATFQPNLKRPLRIGAGANESTPDFRFYGYVDEVAVYSHALTESSILAHYAIGAGDPVAVAPVVVSNPQGLTNFINQPASLAVVATGSLPLNYQWNLNGLPIANATNASFTLPSCQVTNSGDYTVDISNSGGLATSVPVTLLVQNITAPVIAAQPQALTLYAGGTANFAVSATGSQNFYYQWMFNNVNLDGYTNATLTVTNIQAGNAGSYTVVITNFLGAVTSSPALLAVTDVPANTYAGIIMADQPAGFWRLDESSGTTAKDYAGGFDGVYLNGVSQGHAGAITGNSDTSAGFDGVNNQKIEVPYKASLNTSRYSIELWAKVTGGDGTYRSPLTSRDRGGYNFYASENNTWQLWVMNGAGYTVVSGPAVQNGVWTHLMATYDGTTTRFYVNGVLVNSGTWGFAPNSSSVLRIGGGATEDPTGSFFFVGDLDEIAYYPTALSAARVLAHYQAGLGATTPPTITVQPFSQFALAGGTNTFSVTAVGSNPLTYQWQHAGTNLINATNATLVLNNVQSSDWGNYQVIVHNSVGTVTSVLATLTEVHRNTYSGTVMTDQPVGYWKLGELSGTTAYDYAGGFNGTYTNGVSQGLPGAIIGDADTGAGFDGVSKQAVEVPFAPSLNTKVFTAELWTKVTGGADTYRSPLTTRGNPGGVWGGYNFYAADDNTWQLWFIVGNDFQVLHGPAVQIGAWTHLVVTSDGSTVKFYVNGLLVSSRAVSLVPNTGAILRIGGGATELANNDGTFYHLGDIDEVAYYNKVLSPARILEHYEMGLGSTTLPWITTQPASGIMLPGGTNYFSVTAVGSLPLTYQWQYFGTNLNSATNNILGATDAVYALKNAQQADSGNYQVIVSNPAGSITSSVAMLTVVGLPSTTYSNLVVNDGAISYWRLDETTGTTAYDVTGGRNATYSFVSGGLLLGQPGAASGNSDKSAGFSAQNNIMLEVPSYDPALNTSQFSIECWALVNGGSDTFRAVVSSRNTSPERGYILYATVDNQWQFWTGTGSRFVSIGGPTVQNGQWVHLVGTVDGTTERFYINGQLVGVNTETFAINDQTGLFRVGAGKSESTPGDFFFQGSIDEVAYYPTALTAEQILTHYGLATRPMTTSLAITPIDGAVVLTWSGGVLESATSLGGTFTQVPGATSPYTNSISGVTPAAFFRVKSQ